MKASEKSALLHFPKRAVYQGKVVYEVGQHEVPEVYKYTNADGKPDSVRGWIQKWLDRGAILVDQKIEAAISDAKKEQDDKNAEIEAAAAKIKADEQAKAEEEAQAKLLQAQKDEEERLKKIADKSAEGENSAQDGQEKKSEDSSAETDEEPLNL